MGIQDGHQLVEARQLSQLVLAKDLREPPPDHLPTFFLILRQNQEIHQGAGAERMLGRLGETGWKRGDDVNGLLDPGLGHRAGAGNDVIRVRPDRPPGQARRPSRQGRPGGLRFARTDGIERQVLDARDPLRQRRMRLEAEERFGHAAEAHVRDLRGSLGLELPISVASDLTQGAADPAGITGELNR